MIGGTAEASCPVEEELEEEEEEAGNAALAASSAVCWSKCSKSCTTRVERRREGMSAKNSGVFAATLKPFLIPAWALELYCACSTSVFAYHLRRLTLRTADHRSSMSQIPE